MTAIENIEALIKKYFGEDIRISDRSLSNNCIGALVDTNNFQEFTKNFEGRLQRLSEKVTDSVQRKEVIEKIKNLAEKTGYKWAGAYSELVALDFFLGSGYIDNPKFINRFDISHYPHSLAAMNSRKSIDIDFSFDLRLKKYYTDIKSLIPTQVEILDMIIDNVLQKSEKKNVLIGVDDLKPDSLVNFQDVINKEKDKIEKILLDGIKSGKTHIIYTTTKGFSYNFNISYSGMLSTMQTKDPYELAKFDKYKYLNYYNKLLDTDYSLLTFVVNPWFNNQIGDFCNFNKLYYRSVSRRVFIEFKNDITPAASIFKEIKNKSKITISDISTSIAGILFIEDKSVKKDEDDILYKVYLYLNPNYKNKTPLTNYDFASAFNKGTLFELMEIDDFREDNY
ncbi:MAG: hypothetical protein J5930_10650 [Treponema sp.]|nr:hypothetical protein [Treponema sp.]